MSEDRLRKLEQSAIEHSHAIVRNGEKIDDLAYQIAELVKGVKELIEHDHKSDVSNQALAGRFALLEKAIEAAHLRIDKYDGWMSKMIWGIVSALGVAVLGLVIKV